MSYVTADEFTCKCGCNQNDISMQLVSRLNTARQKAGVPFIINSGYRCKSHNAAVGSKSTVHVKGLAADIRTLDSRTRYKVLTALIEQGFSRIGIAKSFIHVDIGDHAGFDPEVVWTYN